MYNALVAAFAIPGALNMSTLTNVIAECKAKFSVRNAVVRQLDILLTME